MQLIECLKQQLILERRSYSPIDQSVIHYLSKGKRPSVSFGTNMLERKEGAGNLVRWRAFSKVCLAYNLDSIEFDELKSTWQELASCSLENHPLEQAYLHLCAHVLKISIGKPLTIRQHKSGRALSSLNDFLEEPALHAHLHAELAILWILVGQLVQDTELVQAGIQAASWQLHSLSQQQLPYRSFLSNHIDVNYSNLVLIQGVLFYGASLAAKDMEMASIANQHFDYLKNKQLAKNCSVEILFLLFLNIFNEQFPQKIIPSEPNLPRSYQPDQEAMVGLRSNEVSLVLHLMGSSASMGALKYEGLEIAAFGPQQGSLADGRLFGSVDSTCLKHPFVAKQSDKEVSLRGLVSLPKLSESSSEVSWEMTSGWLELDISFQQNYLQVQVNPLKVPGQTYFIFYVVADQCLIKAQKKVLYRSLEQFQGDICSVSFLNKKNAFNFDPLFSKGSMKIIPLEGGESFWGANYLIAYGLSDQESSYQWEISCLKMQDA